MPKFKNIYIIALTAVLVTMTSCRASRHLKNPEQPGVDNRGVAERPEPPKPEPRLDEVDNSQCASMTANYGCTVEGIAVTGQIRMMRDSIIWISVNKFVEMGRIVATPTRVRGFVRIPGVYFDGGYDEIARRSDGKIKKEGENVTVNFSQPKHPQRRISVVKKAATSKIVSSELADKGGRQNIRCEYTTRTGANVGSMPSAIGVRLTSPKLNVSTTLMIDKYSFGMPQGFPYSVPSRCKKL